MKVYSLVFLLFIQFPFACSETSEFLMSSPVIDNQKTLSGSKPPVADVVFKSADGGQTWQDISEGLPENLEEEGVVRTVFETSGGKVFIGSDEGLFKSRDAGKNWKQVRAGGLVMKLVESNGVLMATCQDGIIRSTDGGEHWDLVIHEGGAGIAIEVIKGGFAAVTGSSESITRRVRTSYDGGRTWKAIDSELPASLFISSIVQVGEYFFCGHPDGVYRSSDKGKTWKLLFPSIENKVFNLSSSGNVIYAILPRKRGC